jgi:RNA polymerase sigma-70 factor (ECF subfamily)
VQRLALADHLAAVNATEGQAIAIEPVRDAALAFDERFAEARPRLVAICRGLVGDDAEDVVHDTYLRARTRLAQVREPASLEAWLTAVAVRECYARHRRRRRLAEILAAVRHSPPAPVSDPGLRELVEALPPRDRTIVVLHYGHGLSLEGIARLLGEKPATTRSVLFRARARLRASLGE